MPMVGFEPVPAEDILLGMRRMLTTAPTTGFDKLMSLKVSKKSEVFQVFDLFWPFRTKKMVKNANFCKL
jgi:hypothetical protein